MKAAVVTFPGSNCDRDLAVAFEAAGAEVVRVWHKDTELPKGTDVVGLPGGFSFGDYLRCGAIAARSPIGAGGGGPCRAGRLCAGHLQRLPGADRDGPAAGRADAQRGAEVRLQDRRAAGRDGATAPSPRAGRRGRSCSFPSRIMTATTPPMPRRWRACGRGPDRLPLHRTIRTARWTISRASCRANRRVLGLMPHPERVVDAAQGGTDGAALFRAACGRLRAGLTCCA